VTIVTIVTFVIIVVVAVVGVEFVAHSRKVNGQVIVELFLFFYGI